jgi:hypothetical protein
MSDFRQAWDRVAALEGRTFRTDHGQEFSYRFKRTFVVVSPGEHSIPRTNFEKVYKQSPKPVQGRRHIEAIFSDERFGVGG